MQYKANSCVHYVNNCDQGYHHVVLNPHSSNLLATSIIIASPIDLVVVHCLTQSKSEQHCVR